MRAGADRLFSRSGKRMDPADFVLRPARRLLRSRRHPRVARTVLRRPCGNRPAEQGRGLGATLLADSLRKAVAAGEAAAARLVVVDAIDANAARFYERYGFIPAPEHPLRLYRRMKDIARSLQDAPHR